MPAVGAFFAGVGSFLATGAVAGAGVTGAWALGAATASFLTTSFVGKLLTSVALSALSRALAPKPRQPGIVTDTTTSGEDVAQGTVFGWYATAGHHLCPPMTHGTAGKTKNAYLTFVVALSDLPGLALDKVLVNDELVTLGATAEARGFPATGDYAGYMWVRFHNGSQTAADPWLLSTYGVGTSHATATGRPWSADMIGPGLCYAVVTFKYKRSLFNGLPKVLFVVHGVPLYDPRKDSTVGGSGAHRWANKATWETTTNPIVQVYNILRGIEVPSSGVWGLGVPAADLPLSNWFAAMNACDTLVDGKPQYRAGFELSFGEEPADVIEELLKTCSGALAETGGVWKVRAGAPALPVYYFTDDDMMLDDGAVFTPFGSLNETYNGVTASYPDPEALWQPKEAPPRYNSVWEAEDFNRRLVASLGLPACPWPEQVQRLMKAYIEDERRFRRHSLALPPDAAILEPLDVVAWTSAENGYTEKTFEVTEIGDDLGTMVQRLALREVDAADYVWSAGDILPWDTPSVTPARPTPLEPDSFTVSGTSIGDGTAARRPALLLEWSEEDFDLITGVQFEVRRAGTVDVVASGVMNNPSARKLVVSQGLLPAVAYQVRIAYLAPGLDVIWSAWVSATTPDVRLLPADIGPEIISQFEGIAAAAGITSVATLPASGEPNQIFLQLSDYTLYRWDAATSTWSTALYAGVADGSISTAKLAAGAVTANTLAAGAVIASKIAAGAVSAEHVLANSLNANVIGAGRMSTDFLEVNSLLTIDANDAGLSIGKASADDLATPGLYVGTDGATPPGFALVAGRQSGDVSQYLRIGSETGLRLLNARHAVTTPLAPTVNTVTASQTLTLPVGTKLLSLSLLGGGGGGEGITSAGVKTAGSQGGATRVELWDGTTNTGIFWEAAGGLGGGQAGNTRVNHDGESSLYGVGGAGSKKYISGYSEEGTAQYSNANAAPGTGQGAGGGGGSRTWELTPTTPYGAGGRAGGVLAINDYDVSAYANPKLVITIGAGGANNGPTSNPYKAAAGSSGRAYVTATSIVEVPADVVPLVPTATGSFSRVANTPGSFPDLGAGFWLIDTGSANTAMQMGLITIAPGVQVRRDSPTDAAFFSSQTPAYQSNANSTRTIFYTFYSMGSWGGA